jgi:hypothetical protein
MTHTYPDPDPHSFPFSLSYPGVTYSALLDWLVCAQALAQAFPLQ